MAKQLQLRGGTTAEHSTFTGAAREVTVDTDKDTLVVHDGVTAGGFPLVNENGLASSVSTINNSISTVDDKIVSSVASSVLLSGNLALDDYAVTKNFAVVTYTGNGTSQNITTGISSVDFTVSGNGSGYWLDRSTNQVKTDAGTVQASGSCVCNVSKVHIKCRSDVASHSIYDGLRGTTKYIYTNLTNNEGTTSTRITAMNINGFALGVSDLNASGSTYVAYQTLYTHIMWKQTNQGKLQVIAYNPVTRQYIGLVEQSSVAGNEIEVPIQEKSDSFTAKDLDATTDWFGQYGNMSDNEKLVLNSTSAIGSI